MKRPTVASLKKVTPENLAKLGVERLAELLAEVAQGRPELKRRLRMELAAEQGAEHLTAEIDKRLGSFETSKGKISWRQRGAFVRELEALRVLIAERLAGLDRPAALASLWRLLDTHRRIGLRVRDKDGSLAAVYLRAAGDVGGLLAKGDVGEGGGALAAAMAREPSAWLAWLPVVLEKASPELAGAALRAMSAAAGASPTWLPVLRRLADAAQDADAYRATFTEKALADPSVAAEVATRLLTGGRLDEAGKVLERAAPKGRAEPDFEWESAWIDWLERSGQGAAAQDARWASFERTLSAERAREFTRRLADFDDVEAEQRAFDHAARHADFALGLKALMDWPALPDAARMIEARADEADAPPELAEAWAAKLRTRYPEAAERLLRRAAAAAFRRRDFATCDRLTAEAETIAAD